MAKTLDQAIVSCIEKKTNHLKTLLMPLLIFSEIQYIKVYLKRLKIKTASKRVSLNR